MTGVTRRWAPLAASLLVLTAACSPSAETDSGSPAAAPSGTADSQWELLEPAPPPLQRPDLGAIEGHVTLLGRAPGNRVIRMGMDPKCAEFNEGRVVAEEGVVVNREGDLANVFVHLEGDFPTSPPPTRPAQIDQVGCVYVPHVIGAQVGQTIEVHNGDDLAHNVHASSRVDNGFNVGQPVGGLVYRFQPEQEEIMLHVGCDIHRWMSSYVGIVDHPYFAVTGTDGGFSMANVPPGTYTIHGWHEIFGESSQTVEVRAGETAVVDFSFSAEDDDGVR